MAVFNSTYDEEHRWLLLPSIYEIFAKLWEFNLSFVCHKFLWLCQKFLSFPKLCIISLNRIYSFINTLRTCWFLGLWGDFLLKGGSFSLESGWGGACLVYGIYGHLVWDGPGWGHTSTPDQGCFLLFVSIIKLDKYSTHSVYLLNCIC